MRKWTPLVGERAAEIVWVSDIRSAVSGLLALVGLEAAGASFARAISVPLGIAAGVLAARLFLLCLRQR